MPFTQPKPLQAPPEEVAGTSVLVVDDEVVWRTILRTDLELLGYRTLLAGDAEEALEVARAHRPELAIVDLMLPEPMDGRALVRLLRERGLAFPVIFYTAYPVFSHADDSAGVVAYMSKSVDRADLYALIPPAVTEARGET
ncbi:MAG: response regulator [Candidatus Dormibacteraeota bacterium]|nr:response regulator [Candidatus Dormibacteraeota bacterium]